MPCSRSPRGGSPGPHPRGSLGGSVQGGAALGGVPTPGGVWPSVMAFWFGGLLIEGGLLVWSSVVVFSYVPLLWPSGLVAF